jgi:hypothetical protein
LARSASLAVAAAVLSGCLVADVGVEVGDDGSGRVVIEVFPADQFRDRLSAIDLEDLESLSRSEGAQVDLSQIGTIGRRGYRIEVPFDDYRVLNTVGEGGVRFGGVDLRLFNTFGLTETGGNWTLFAELRPLDELVATLRQVLGVGSVDDAPEVTLRVTLPGRVIRSNADQQEGGTAAWELDFSTPANPANSVTQLEMRTEPVPLVTPAQMVLLAAAVTVVLGLVLVVVTSGRASRPGKRRRRLRRRRGTTDDAGWSATPFDAPKDGQAAVAPPLAWQTYKPGEEPQGAVPPPVAPSPAAPSPAAPTGALPPITAAPPAPPTASAAPGPPHAAAPSAGWYPDPGDPSRLRWWDGSDWSGHTSDWV